MFRHISIALFVLVSSYCQVHAKKIVMLAPPHAANVNTFISVGRVLTTMGHKTYVTIPDSMVRAKSVNVNGILPIYFGKDYPDVDGVVGATSGSQFWNNQTDGISSITSVLNMANDLINRILSDHDLLQQLKRIDPDLFVIGHVVMARNIVTLPYMMDKPFVAMSAMNDYTSQRTPISLSASPTQVYGGYRLEGMTFQQRFFNSLANLLMTSVTAFTSSEDLVAKYVPDRPTISTDRILAKAEIFILECDPIMDYARPTMPNVKFVGSTAGKDGSELKEPYKSFVDKSEHGIVIVTLGSYFKDYPEYASSKMISAFMRLKQTVIWRSNVTSVGDKILSTSWLPQNDLLAHPKARLFVSHCGANGQYEGLYHAVPMLCLPVFGDQMYNAERNVVKGFGLQADIRTITSDEFLALMLELLENDKYRNTIQEASNIYKELFPNPIDKAAFWIDHVTKFGGSYMRSAGNNMPMWQFLDVDIWAVLTSLVLLVCLVVYLTCRGLCRVVCGRKSKDKVE